MSEKPKIRIKVLDCVIIAAAILAIAFSCLTVYGKGNAEPEVKISSQGGDYIYPLKDERRLQIEGPLGVTVVHIHDGSVQIEDSPCPNRTCVAAGAISRPGQWVACMPNQVFISIEGSSNEKSVDAGVY